MEYTYCTATSTGKDFFTAQDSNTFYLSPHPGNVWVLENSVDGVCWINRVDGIRKTKEEAQAIVDGEIETAQAAWDNFEYGRNREGEYPTIGEQFDLLFKDIAAGTLTTSGGFYTAIKAVKDKYPKPS